MIKRFYKTASAAAQDDGFAVLLDGRVLKSPGRIPVIVPSRALAEAIAAEWEAQTDEITPRAMPLTRLIYAAVDGAAEKHRIAEQALAFARSDLLCYRADRPQSLAARQQASWDPLLEWLAEHHGARLVTATGITFAEQPEDALTRLASDLAPLDACRLVGLHTVTTITGSLTLALALLAGRISAAEAFALARLDEDFQAEQWGRDAEAEARARALAEELAAAERFLRLLSSG